MKSKIQPVKLVYECLAIISGTLCILIGFTQPSQAASECTEISQIPAAPIYTVISPPGGDNNDIQDLGSLEERVTVLSSTYTVTYQCTDTDGTIDRADIQARMTAFEAPSTTTGATNLDVPANGSEATIGVNHQVLIEVIGDTSISPFGNSGGTTIVNRRNFNPRGGNANLVRFSIGPNCAVSESSSGVNCELDASDQISFVVTSTFSLAGGAEEFLAGDYSVTFRTRVRPDNSGGNLNGTGGTNPRIEARTFTTITYSVEKECSIDTQSLSSVAGNPRDYSATIPLGGGNGTIQEDGFLEERTTVLSATETIGVDCNTPTAELDVALDQFFRPDFTNATNLADIDHTITLASPGGTTDMVLPSVPASTTNVPIVTNQIETTDANADLSPLSLTSTLSANGEELAGGNYRSDFIVTVTAQ